MVRRDDIVSTARSYLDTPFVHQGRVPKVGLDCGGVLVAIWRRFGLTDYDAPPYPAYMPVNTAVDSVRRSGVMRQKLVSQILPGDVAIVGGRTVPTHIAICTATQGEHLTILHASPGAGKVVEQTAPMKLICAAFEFLAIEG